MRLICLASLLIFFTSCYVPGSGLIGGFNTPAKKSEIDECGFHTNHFGNGYRWNRLPIHITLHEPSLDQKMGNSVVYTIDTLNGQWRRFTGKSYDLFEVAGYTRKSLDRIRKDEENTIVVIKGDSLYNDSRQNQVLHSVNFPPKVQGMTQIKGKHLMSSADVYINNRDHLFYYDPDLAMNTKSSNTRAIASFDYQKSSPTFFEKIKRMFYHLWDIITFKATLTKGRQIQYRQDRIPSRYIDFQSLVAHELGHVVGLGHNSSRNSIMNRVLKQGILRRGFKDEDLASLYCGYGAL